MINKNNNKKYNTYPLIFKSLNLRPHFNQFLPYKKRDHIKKTEKKILFKLRGGEESIQNSTDRKRRLIKGYSKPH